MNKILEQFQQRLNEDWLIGDRSCLFNSTFEAANEQIKNLSSHERKLNLLVCDRDPIKFIAYFLAAVFSDCNIFLGSPDWKKQEWEQVFNLVRPDLILGDEKGALDDRPAITNHLLPITYCQQLIMIPTGGSSGTIRFAMHTWKTLTASIKAFQQYFDLQTINSFCILPLYHVSGLMQFMRSFVTSGKLVIFPYKFLKEGKRIEEIHLQEFFISLVPTQLQFLWQTDPNWLSSFQTVLLGGAPAWRSLLDDARKHQIRLAPTYGMTEIASQVVPLKPEDFLAGNNSSGRVLPHSAIEINCFEGKREGIITIKSNSLCLGYYPHFFENREVFLTDDFGFFDNTGYLHIVGRNSQKIITGGENIFPAEVEAVILATGLVSDVCVIGLPDWQWGQVVVAVYVSARADLSSIEQKLEQQLSNYKKPKHWIQVTKLPRNQQGKIDRQQIMKVATEKIGNS
ncbi:MAG: 2-succinylbenzoate--CoA ligase [Xenococcaceae cyanobacterium]